MEQNRCVFQLLIQLKKLGVCEFPHNRRLDKYRYVVLCCSSMYIHQKIVNSNLTRSKETNLYLYRN